MEQKWQPFGATCPQEKVAAGAWLTDSGWPFGTPSLEEVVGLLTMGLGPPRAKSSPSLGILPPDLFLMS